ncbi:MAG: hypothetical protein JST30_11310 [Armatimonadetes bacterium]|nr:hypothetical protein [Armatimonadota bacterium]
MTDEELLSGHDRATQIAYHLLKLGVSHKGVQELLIGYPYDQIEKQLEYLPYRKAKRPEAFIMDAVRNNYSPPKEFYYAKAQTESSEVSSALDEGSQLSDPNPAPNSDRHGIAPAPDSTSPNSGMEQA